MDAERRVAEWQRRLDELTGLYRQELEGLDEDELNWKPAPDVWSVGQNVDHVVVTNEKYYPVVERLRRGEEDVPWIGRIGFVRRLMGWLILEAVEPERRRKVSTFPVFEPSGSDVPADILERFVEHQGELARFIADSTDLVARGAVLSSPVSRYFVYDLGTAFEMMVTHERRHLNQIRETLELLRAS